MVSVSPASAARPEQTPESLAASAAAGDRRALARLLTVIERGGAPARAAAIAVHAHARAPYTVGLTGAPGAGKSTLTDALIAVVRKAQESIAVVAIDPSSPFTGGAILGDRVRLRVEHAGDDGTFVRSLASRGHLGGLAQAVPEVVRAIGSAGWPTVVLETVGVGQTEVAIAAQADTTVVLVTPGWGDEVQANKSGLLEIADVLIVNKADRDGARLAVRDLNRMLDLAPPRDWRPQIVTTVAVQDVGVGEAWEAICAHRAHLEANGELERRRAARLVTEVEQRVISAISADVARSLRSPTGRELLSGLYAGDIPPAAAVSTLLATIAGNGE